MVVAAPEADVGLILRRHGHDEAQWATIEGEMKNALVDDAVRGSGELLRTFDDAYVARMADLGRKIDLRGHARLQIATSRKEVSRCLADLGLGGPDLMPIRRTFARSLEKNASLATDLAKIVDTERVLSPPRRKGIFGGFR